MATCYSCGQFEHFSGAKLSNDIKEDIVKGDTKYYCSVCLSGNRALSNEIVTDIQNPRQVPGPQRGRFPSIPIFGQGYSNETTDSDTISRLEDKSGESESDGVDTPIIVAHMTDTNSGLQEKKEMSCKLCNDIFRDEKLFKDHMVSIHDMQCPLCDYVCTDIIDLSSHHESLHTIRCPKCNFKDEMEESVNEHIRINHVSEIPETQDIFKGTGNKKGENTEQEQISCWICYDMFSNEEDLKSHLNSTHGATGNDNNASCVVGNKSFQSEVELRDHTETNAERNKDKCPFCNKTHNSQDNSEEHIQIHSQNEKKRMSLLQRLLSRSG